VNYNIKILARFEKELKRLAKKYPSLKAEYIELVKHLKQQPKQGTAIGNNCYKIRMSIASQGKGKSGGARVITYLQISDTTVFYSPFMINLIRKIFRTRSCPNYLNGFPDY